MLAPHGLPPAAHPPAERAVEGTFYKCVLREVGLQPRAHSLGARLDDWLTRVDKKPVEASAPGPLVPLSVRLSMLLHVRP